MKLKNKNILIAGASGFLGKEITKVCLENGANCILVDKDHAKLNKIFLKFKKKNIIPCDITNDADLLNLKKKIKQKNHTWNCQLNCKRSQSGKKKRLFF